MIADVVTPDSRTVRSGSADGPPRQRLDIYLDECGTRLSFLIFLLISTRAERSSSARAAVASSRRSPSSGHHTSIPRARTFPGPVSYGRNRPRHRPSPLEALEALLHRRSASPVILRPNRSREWIRGEFLVLPGLFPFRGVSPAPMNGRRHRRRTCCRLRRGSEVRHRGRSAWEARTVRRSD